MAPKVIFNNNKKGVRKEIEVKVVQNNYISEGKNITSSNDSNLNSSVKSKNNEELRKNNSTSKLRTNANRKERASSAEIKKRATGKSDQKYLSANTKIQNIENLENKKIVINNYLSESQDREKEELNLMKNLIDNRDKSNKRLKQEANKDSETEDRLRRNTMITDEKFRSKKTINSNLNSNTNNTNQNIINKNYDKIEIKKKSFPLEINKSKLNLRSIENMQQLSQVIKKSKNSSISIDKEHKLLSQDEKIELMEKLVKNKEEEIIKDVQKEVIKKGKQANDKIQKKLKYLSDKNMLENINLDMDNEIMEIAESGQNDISNHEIQEENNIIKQGSYKHGSRSNKFSNSSSINPNRSKSSPAMKKCLKPKVDSLEYLINILNERKVNPNEEEMNFKTDSKIKGTERSSKDKNNSFRKSNSEDKNKLKSQESDENYLLTSKHNKRDSQQLREFMIRKKIEEKEKAIKLQKEIEDKNLKKIIELAKVLEHQKAYVEPVRKSQSQSRQTSSGNYKISSGNKFRSSSHKVKNDMYRGRSSKNSLNDSSYIDADEYYFSLLESKNILTPGYNTINRRTASNELPRELNKDISNMAAFSSGSNLSNFTKNSKKNFNKAKNEETDEDNKQDIELDDKHVYQSKTREEFLKFIEQKEKEITVRSSDSNEILTMKVNSDNEKEVDHHVNVYNPNKQTGNFKKDNKINEIRNKVNEIKQHGNNLAPSEGNSSRSNSSKKLDNKISIINNKESVPVFPKSVVVKQESVDVENINSSMKKQISEENINEFVSLIKMANKKNVFYSLMQEIQIIMLMQHYDISFKYLEELSNVILSRNVVTAFNILKENAIIQNYHNAFNFFCIPIKRQAFLAIREAAFADLEEYDLRNIDEDNRRGQISEAEEYTEEVNEIPDNPSDSQIVEIYENCLNKLLLFPKRIGFSALKEHLANIYLDDEIKLQELYTQGINMLFNPWKRNAFYIIAKVAFNIDTNVEMEDQDQMSIKNNSVIIHDDKSHSSSKFGYFNMEEENNPKKDEFIDDIHVSNLGDRSLTNRLNMSLKSIKSKRNSSNKQTPNLSKNNSYSKSYNSLSKNDSFDNNDNLSKKNSFNNHKSQRSHHSQHSQHSQYSQNSQNYKNYQHSQQSQRFQASHNSPASKFSQNISINNQIRRNTFVYESLQSNNSSISVYPNSLDSPHLHRIHELIRKQQERLGNVDQSGAQENVSLVSDSETENNKNIYQSLEKQEEYPKEVSEDHSNSYSNNRLNYSDVIKHNPKKNYNNFNFYSDEKEDDIVAPPSKEERFNTSSNLNCIDEDTINKSRSVKSQVNSNKISPKYENKNTDFNKEESIAEEINDEQDDFIMKTKSSQPARKNQSIGTDPDISADRDDGSDIDWIQTISQSKSSGSFRDAIINNNLSKNNQSSGLLENDLANNSNKVSNLKEILERDEEMSNHNETEKKAVITTNLNNNLQSDVDKDLDIETDAAKNELKTQSDAENEIVNGSVNNNSNSKISEQNIVLSKENKGSSEDKYDEYYGYFIEDDAELKDIKDTDEAKDFIDIISNEGFKEPVDEEDEENNKSINNNKIDKNNTNSPSINSFKSRNNLDKKKPDEVQKGRDNLGLGSNYSLENLDHINDEDKESPSDLNFNQNKTTEEIRPDNALIERILNGPDDLEKEINLEDKGTIESLDLNKVTGNFYNSPPKEKQSIESNNEGYFVVKPGVDLKNYNLLDEESSYNKSIKNQDAINSPYSSEIDLKTINDGTSIISNLTPNIKQNIDVESKDSKDKTISINNQSMPNKRYDNLLEDYSARKTERSGDSGISISSEFEEKINKVDLNALSDQITNAILEELLMSEIKDESHNLIPKKCFKPDKESSTPVNLTASGSLSGAYSNKNKSLMDDSVYVASQSSINNSIFMKSVVDKKKENSLNLYMDKIAPKLIKSIGDQVDKDYNKILDNLKIPYSHDPSLLIQSLVSRDQNLLKKAYKFLPINNKTFIDKKAIMPEFEKENKIIRENDNIASDNYYDNIFNECMIDASDEILNKERLYGEIGKPLPWSNRTRSVAYKYNKNEISKSNLKKNIEKELLSMANYQMGLIAENHDYLDLVQLNEEREKRLMTNIVKELIETEEIWKNFELEETQVKLEISEMVLEQLLNEVVEILEHVQLSRRRPGLYQYKSIYACEDIPRLSFQQYNTDNDCDNINI